MQDLDAITAAVIDASIRIHRDLGPGLLESVYEAILARVLQKAGFDVERQKALAFEYEELVFQDAYRVDLLIDGSVIVEIKSVEQIGKQHAKQLLTYLKLSNIQVGLLINFGAPVLRDGVRRVVNGFVPPASPRLRVNQRFSENA
jgi:GxxExxY protein